MKKECSIDGCNIDVRLVRGLCGTHYMRAKVRGDFQKSICSVDQCARPDVARGLCPMHYRDLRRNGGLGGKGCSFQGCDKFAITKELCVGHYNQHLKGKPLKPLRKPAGDWSEWRLVAKGYVLRRRTVNGYRENQWQHRFVMEEHIGRVLLACEDVHHKNGNRSDNRLSNLEIWNTQQPKGQRPEDKIEYALEILNLYSPEKLVK